jgi:hypothetical protein
MQLDTVTSAGGVSLDGASIDVGGMLTAARALLVKAREALALGGKASAGSDLTLASDGSVATQQLAAGGNASITATGAATLGDLDVDGAVSAKAASLIMSSVKAGTTLDLVSTGDLTLGASQAGGNATISAAGGATIGDLVAGGAIGVEAASLTMTSAKAGTTLDLASTGDLSLGGGQASGAVTIDAGKRATLGAITAGPSLTILAADAELTGMQRATAITIRNRASDTSSMRLGDGTANDGFRLSNDELGRISADTLTIDQGAGSMEIGAVNFTGDAGRQNVKLLSTGLVTVDGVVSGGGAGRRFQIGGVADSDTAAAKSIQIVATSVAGGRLLLNDADLDLRGDRIAAGLAPGFLDALEGDDAATVASGFVGNPNSALYNANLGGGFYDPSATTIVSAHSLTVHYVDYALFQNTAAPGQTSGVTLGGTGVRPALVLAPKGAAGSDSFALFGKINGIDGAAAALLGADVLSTQGANLAATRVNGCLVASGGGCLTTIVIKPTLQVFEVTSADVFGAAQDLSIPFDPVVGGANEGLLTDLTALASDVPDIVDRGDATPTPPAVNKETGK